VSTMGRLDVVFSNAGWTHFRTFSNLDDNMVEDDWDRCFNMNVKSHLFLMHAAKEHLDKTQGSFITTASLAGVVAGGSSLVSSSVPTCVIAWYCRCIILPDAVIGLQCDQSSSDSSGERPCCIRRAKHQSEHCVSRSNANSKLPPRTLQLYSPKACGILTTFRNGGKSSRRSTRMPSRKRPN
jgi:NAD(P)-dependent dehydrogenase (short-subunit alcohol dehydrogenase family)